MSGGDGVARGGAVGRRWNAFWFAPASPVTLGFLRAIFFGWILIIRLPADTSDWSHVPRAFYRPIELFEVLRLPVLGPMSLRLMEIAWWGVLLCCATGLFARLATWAAFAMSLYLLGLPNNFGKVGHGDQLTVLLMLIFALSRCGDAFALDAIRRRRRSADPLPPPEPSPDYRWPIRMVWVLMSLIFFAAGVAKLVRGGVGWVTSDNFSIMLIQAHYGLNRPPTTWGLTIAQVPWLCHLIAGGSLLLELIFPLALFGRWTRRLIVPLTLSMQLGIGLLMGIWFTPFLLVYLFWLPWDAILLRLREGRRGAVIPKGAVAT